MLTTLDHRLQLNDKHFIVTAGGKKPGNDKQASTSMKASKSEGSTERVKQPNYLPAQYCIVLSGQAYRKLLSMDQISSMIRFANRSPLTNVGQIEGSGLSLFGISPNDAMGPVRIEYYEI